MIELFAGFVLTMVLVKLAVVSLLLVCAAVLVIGKLQQTFGPDNSHAAEPGTFARRRWGTA